MVPLRLLAFACEYGLGPGSGSGQNLVLICVSFQCWLLPGARLPLQVSSRDGSTCDSRHGSDAAACVSEATVVYACHNGTAQLSCGKNRPPLPGLPVLLLQVTRSVTRSLLLQMLALR